MSIQETLLKIKGAGKLPRIALETLLLGIILSIVFFFGKSLTKKTETLSSSNFSQASSVINLDIPSNHPSVSLDAIARHLPLTGEETPKNFVASKTGKVYYPSSCKALGRIKLANRIYFSTASDAQAKHLTLSKSCK